MANIIKFGDKWLPEKYGDEALYETFDMVEVKFLATCDDLNNFLEFSDVHNPDIEPGIIMLRDRDSTKKLAEQCSEYFDYQNSKGKTVDFYDIGKYLQESKLCWNVVQSVVHKDHPSSEASFEKRFSGQSVPDNYSILDKKSEASRVQAVLECAKIVLEKKEVKMAKKLLSTMGITKDIARRYCTPEIYKSFEQTVFAPSQKLDRSQGISR